MARAAKQVPSSDAGNARVKLSNVEKVAQQNSGTRKAMTGVPGSGPVGSDSRPGAFRNALDTVKSQIPPTVDGVLKDTNRSVRTGSGRTRSIVGEPLKLDSRGRGPNADGGPRRTDPIEHNDMGGAIRKMMSGSNRPGMKEAAARVFGPSDRAGQGRVF